jgi:hypothetical protein
MKHFATKKEAMKHLNKKPGFSNDKIWRKIKGQKNRVKKPFVVGTEIEWLNLN